MEYLKYLIIIIMIGSDDPLLRNIFENFILKKNQNLHLIIETNNAGL